MWTTSIGRDLSHHNPIANYDAARAALDWTHIKITESTSYTDPMAAQHHRGFAGKPRGAYHFARSVSIPDQIRHFLTRKNAIGRWERPDMLDCEFPGVTGVFIRRLVAEYRRQSGIRLVLVYAGVVDLKGPCDPNLWYDNDTPIWAARYRKIGPPKDPDAWAAHLGWDHPGLAIYQYDNATPLAGGGLTDINIQRVRLDAVRQENDIVKQLMLAREKGGPAVWVGDGVIRRHIEDEKELANLRYWIGLRGGDTEIHDFDDIRVLGMPVIEYIAELRARPVADIDEAALAAELTAHGWDPATAAEVKDIVLGAFTRAGQPEGATS